MLSKLQVRCAKRFQFAANFCSLKILWLLHYLFNFVVGELAHRMDKYIGTPSVRCCLRNAFCKGKITENVGFFPVKVFSFISHALLQLTSTDGVQPHSGH